jgi:hypothetical protein
MPSSTPVLEGDMLSVVEEVVSVSRRKTRLGTGHFIETGDLPAGRRNRRRHLHKHVVPFHPAGDQ